MMITEQDKTFMREAIRLAKENIDQGGGPFGAVIVKDGKILAASGNSVTKDNDPTAHAEVNAIRRACRQLGTFELTGCTLYTSCEPCPMCLGAIYWAHIDRIFYGCTRKDAKEADFDDDHIYCEIGKDVSERSIPTVQLFGEEAKSTFKHWAETADKIRY
jgi:tRNA(Arg) A34 adenosine deaminase TadA